MPDAPINYGTDQQDNQPPAASPQPQSDQQESSVVIPPSPPAKNNSRSFIAVLATVAIVIVVLAGLLYIKSVPHPKKITTTTTIPTVNLSDVSNCTVISKPGKYYLISSVATKERSGACIRIDSSNVVFDGNNNLISGSGPYAIVPPYSYGIEVANAQNVTVEDLTVSHFSYGIFSNRTNSLLIRNTNATNNTMSNVYLLDSYNALVTQVVSSKASSDEGGFYLAGGAGNKLTNDISNFNLYYGLVVNSSNNIFQNDHFVNNPEDIMCVGVHGFMNASEFSNVSCNTNFYCDFASCSKTNVPTNFTSITLLPGNVSTCGEILYSGNYFLPRAINVAQFVNTSNPLTKALTCIQIKANYVSLNCKGHGIKNAGVAILSNKTLYTSIANCSLTNDPSGIKLLNSISANVTQSSISNASIGVYLYNSTGGSISNVSVTRSGIGIYSNESSGLIFSNLNLHNNSYGFYFDSGSSDAFNGGSFYNNSKIDMYCSSQSYNSTTNLFQKTKCGVTDCDWASCASHVLPTLSIYPIIGCQPISTPGNYSINKNIIAKGNCFKITASNVTLNCNNSTLTGSGTGYGFNISNVSNLHLENCKLNNFASGLVVNNVAGISINNIQINATQSGVLASNVIDSQITNVHLQHYSAYGFVFNTISHSAISFDSAQYGTNNATGFVIKKATYNVVSFDSSRYNPAYGFDFENFTNNTVYNNTAFSNKRLDYYCSPSSSGLYANLNGINSGSTKNICRWLVVLPAVPVNPPCQAISSASSIFLSSDMVYSYGSTCFNVFNQANTSANNTVINCNGHTVLATAGGTFVNVVNSSNIEIENCYLKNFSTPIVSHGSFTQIINNTFGTAKTGITLVYSNDSTVQYNNFTNLSTGVSSYDSDFVNLLNNRFSNVNSSIVWNLGSQSKFSGNKAYNGLYGLKLINSTSNFLKNNVFANMSKAGIACYGIASSNKSINQDFGNETCSSNLNCTWIVSPKCK
ncbi:MAG: right-handed parallel beta-helix repeat-containing protein [Candidatus Micrarchaeia archaeon]